MEFKAFLIKYAEIGIKGNNRRFFEDALVRQMKYCIKAGWRVCYPKRIRTYFCTCIRRI